MSNDTAQRLLEAAVTAKFEEHPSGFLQEKLPDGRQRVVRNGTFPSARFSRSWHPPSEQLAPSLDRRPLLALVFQLQRLLRHD